LATLPRSELVQAVERDGTLAWVTAEAAAAADEQPVGGAVQALVMRRRVEQEEKSK
jgi:hypothetical protein